MRSFVLLVSIVGCGSGSLVGLGSGDAGLFGDSSAASDAGDGGVIALKDASTSDAVQPPLMGCDGGNYFIEVSSDAGADMLRGRPGNLAAPPDWSCGGGVGEDCFSATNIAGASSIEMLGFIAPTCACNPLSVGTMSMQVSYGQDGGGAWTTGALFGSSTVRVDTLDSTMATGDYDAVLSIPKDGGSPLYLHGKFCIAPGP